MSSPVAVDIFVEDRAHEAFLVPMLQRIARQENIVVSSRVRTGRGGHGRAVAELALYQRVVKKGAPGFAPPDLLIAGIDGNCSTFAKAKKAIEEATNPPFSDRLVVACPDPHVERWYLADPASFQDVIGHQPTIGKKKCTRNYYKNALANAVRKAGHPATLGGIEFAPELVERMDLYRAGKNARSLKAFVDDLRGKLRTLTQGR
jgi:Domain of unknown function (DUF4276)